MSVPLNEARTATVTSVASSASSVNLLDAERGRVGASIFNKSNSRLYIKFGTTASASDFSVMLEPYALYELPDYYRNGRVDGIWTSVHGAALVTEVV